ncbi:MAG: YdcF family protein [Clostridia bacterium]|nr:YdcF family protein [Clostridia bacterium]
MKFSEARLDALLKESYERKWELVCGKICDDGESADVALLLGTRPAGAIERARAAAELYHAGRVKYVVPSGGVAWEYKGETLTEAELMARVLIENGVPEEAIRMENEARTTKENMICGTLTMSRAFGLSKVYRIIIVTTVCHMQRSMLLAHALLPRQMHVSAYPSHPDVSKEEWLASAENREILDNAIRLTKGLVDCGIVEDFEI